MGDELNKVMDWRESFVSNRYSERRHELQTAAENKFYNGYTKLDFDLLEEGIVGIDLMMTKNLGALIGYESELLAGKRVDVRVRYVLNEDRSDFEKVDVTGVEVVKRDSE